MPDPSHLLSFVASIAMIACSGAPSGEPAPSPRQELPGAAPEAAPETPPAADPAPEPSVETAPEPAGASPGEYRELASFGGNTCGLRLDGRIHCWSTLVNTTPVVAEGVFEHLGQGAANVCGVTADGALGCPPGPVIDPMAQNGPIGLPPGGPFRALTGGYNFRCALERTGTIRCRGGNALLTPQPPEGSFVAVAVGGSSVCGLTEAGRVACSTADGQPTELDGGPYLSIAGSENAVCGLRRSDGGVDCSRPLPGDGMRDTGFTQIAVGMTHGCGLREGGVHCWGMMIDPAHFPPPGEPAERVTVGQHTCLLRRDHSVGCWDTHQVTLRMP